MEAHARSKVGLNVYRATRTSTFGVAMALDPYPATAEGGISYTCRGVQTGELCHRGCLLQTVVTLITAFFFRLLSSWVDSCFLREYLVLGNEGDLFFFYVDCFSVSL